MRRELNEEVTEAIRERIEHEVGGELREIVAGHISLINIDAIVEKQIKENAAVIAMAALGVKQRWHDEWEVDYQGPLGKEIDTVAKQKVALILEELESIEPTDEMRQLARAEFAHELRDELRRAVSDRARDEAARLVADAQDEILLDVIKDVAQNMPGPDDPDDDPARQLGI